MQWDFKRLSEIFEGVERCLCGIVRRLLWDCKVSLWDCKTSLCECKTSAMTKRLHSQAQVIGHQWYLDLLLMYLSNSTKMTTNTETAMLSSMVEAVELPICDGGCQVKCRQAGQVHQISYTGTIKYVTQGQVQTTQDKYIKCIIQRQVQPNTLYRDK